MCSAAEMTFEFGALHTMTPRSEAASISMLSTVTPARPMILRFSAASQQRRVDHRVRMHDERVVGSDGRGELLGRGIDEHVNFIAVLGERIDAFLHQILGNQDLFRHERHLPHSSPSQGFRFITGRLAPPLLFGR